MMLGALRAQRAEIHSRWETLLRIEPANTPLALPDTMVHLIGPTLDEVFAGLANPQGLTHIKPAHCRCGRNPLLAFFRAGELALLESLIMVQVATPDLAKSDREEAVTNLKQILHALSWREIAEFCSVCQYPDKEPAKTVKES
ncbi:MAG: hypothetical protein K9M98_04900 [Cephaloticoccus sp.]|nr:hypothetical protein [Cephaloticoccus sp.]MCF7759820.1 hypothetical protein [Cephaloticoccus sp.]